MDYSDIRKLFLKGFLGFLILTAVLAIISILTNAFGEFQAKILGTSAMISGASIGSMACAAFLERKKLPVLGITGIALSVTTAILGIVALWFEIENPDFLRVIMTFFVAALAFAHAFLLVLPELDENQKWVQVASSVSISVLAVMIISLVWGDFRNEMFFRFLAVVSILVGLVTLAVPLMMKLRKGDQESVKKLTLTRVDGDTYEDEDGARYRVQAIADEEA